jgi:hypothetical protein
VQDEVCLRPVDDGEVLLGDHLEVEEPAAHLPEVLERARGVAVLQVLEHAVADDEVEPLARAPAGDVVQLVAVPFAGERRDVDRAIAGERPVAAVPATPQAGARPDVEDRPELHPEPLGEPADAARDPGDVRGRVRPPRPLVEAAEVSGVEAGGRGHRRFIHQRSIG